jgi:hypothetical protein
MIDPTTGLALDSHKPIDITINAPELIKDDRENSYDHIN